MKFSKSVLEIFEELSNQFGQKFVVILSRLLPDEAKLNIIRAIIFLFFFCYYERIENSEKSIQARITVVP